MSAVSDHDGTERAAARNEAASLPPDDAIGPLTQPLDDQPSTSSAPALERPTVPVSGAQVPSIGVASSPRGAARPRSSDEIHVVFIGGASRTGSTLLSLLLGSLPGYFAAGEVRYVWLRGLKGNQLCECGEPFRSCDVWRRVVDRGLGPVDVQAAEELASLWNVTATFRPVLRSVLSVTDRSSEARNRYLDRLRRLLMALRSVTRARFLVDASKYATDAMLLAQLPGVRVRTLHLVRDSRAVAHSWTRRKKRPEIHWREQHMELMSPAKSSWHWASMNAAMEVAGSRIGAYDRIRYEDLVRDPVGSLGPILPPETRPALEEIIGGGMLRPRRGHSFSGNPVRFEGGPLRIRADDEWLRAMDEGAFRVVSTMTLPLLLRYGYPVGRRGWSRSFGAEPRAG